MALTPAVIGVARFGATRFGYVPPALAAVRRTRVRMVLAGADARERVRVGSLRIRDELNDAPNTAQFVIDGTAPVTGQDLRVTINSDDPRLLFNGTLQTVDVTYEGKPSQVAWQCTAIDDTARVNRKRPFGTWTAVSATTIAQYLIANFAPGFTSTHVEASLPAVSVNFDGSEGFSGCIRQLAKLIGGYFYFEDLDLHLFQTEATDAPDDLDSTPGRFLNDPPINASSDDSQVRNRVYGKGHGEALLSAVAIGGTILPVENAAAWFSASGGSVISGTQRLTYTGLTASAQTGSSVETGAPTTAPTLANSATGGGGLGVGSQYFVAVSFVGPAGESRLSPASNSITAVTDGSGGSKLLDLSAVPLGPAGTTKRLIYRTLGGGLVFYKTLNEIPDNSTTIASGVAGMLDSNQDDQPIASGTQGPDVAAGSTSVPVLDLAQFGASGGVAQAAEQVFRYTGRSASSGRGNLTGIPASGPLSIVAPIPSGTAIANVPALIGVPASGAGSVAVPLVKGDLVSLWVQRDDVASQAVVTALDLAQGRISDGIVEGPLIVDERRGEDSLTALCDADLALFASPLVTVTYATRDVKTKSGKPIVVDLGSPPISTTLTIHDVNIDQIDVLPGVAPRFSATASTERQTLDAILRQLITKSQS